jgi:homotetrameric cytidine deaminase
LQNINVLLKLEKINNVLKFGAYYGHLCIVKFLVDHGANVHSWDDCALKLSATYGHLHVVKFLVECDTDVHVQGNFALRYSAYHGHLGVVKFLVECGADVYAEDDEALRWSAESGHLDVVKYLVECGADVHARNDAALEQSERYGHLDVVKYLVDHVENVNKTSKIAVQSTLENYILYYSKNSKIAFKMYNWNVLYKIKNFNVDYSWCYPEYLTFKYNKHILSPAAYIIRTAIKYGNLNVIKYIFSKNLYKYHEYDNLLVYCCMHKALDIYKYLIDYTFLNKYTCNVNVNNTERYHWDLHVGLETDKIKKYVHHKNNIEMLLKRPKHCYAPYSNLKVYCKLSCNTTDEIFGYNIENASYSVTMCAEKVAIAAAISKGINPNTFTALYLTSNHPTKIIYPCGSCLQMLSEFCTQDFEIVLYQGALVGAYQGTGENMICTTLGKLLPSAFTL